MKKRTPLIFLIATFVPLAVILLWTPVVEPAVVRFPASVDVANHYGGTLTTFVDSTTGATMSTPLTVPVAIDRTTKSVPGETTAHRAVVKETVTIRAAGTTQTQVNVYVFDRRTMKNLQDSRATAYGVLVDRSGSYYPNLPMGTKADGRYPIWRAETSSTYTMASAGSPTSARLDGLRTLRMAGAVSQRPVSLPYATQLASQGLPTLLTFAQIKTQLVATGIDVDQVMKGLASALPKSDAAILAKALATPIPLRYSSAMEGNAAVEPRTGTVAALTDVSDALFVAPVLTPWAPAAAMLAAHTDIPLAQVVSGLLTGMASAPAQPVYQVHYQETVASVGAQVRLLKHQIRRMDMVKTWVPVGLVALAAALAIMAAYQFGKRPPSPAPTALPTGGRHLRHAA